jgi:hypothetical protein
LAAFNVKSNVIGCILAQIVLRPEKTVPFHRLPFGGTDFGEIQAVTRNRMEAEQGMWPKSESMIQGAALQKALKRKMRS